jgi:hypothetical protein
MREDRNMHMTDLRHGQDKDRVQVADKRVGLD